ncbi:aromatic acid exporter family protein [Caldalkalibacillus mannanilyticus]|uniref:aromatic acid exporter family protein n=1 Tax=Caldalkalibacillus mannanilyticus TaxID=1418 RepID=UPI000468E80E|nr:aromatic acid exporter family protein [Caldalkalibacillus mannanilyticus]
MKIGIRTLKTAVGAGLAIWLAQLLHLEFYVNAGILAILSIETTKKRSLHVATTRFIASILGLFLSGFAFEVLGYHIIVISLFILFFIPLLIYFNIQSGFVTSSVIILHVFVLGEFNTAVIMNELLLIIVGIGVALLINSYMPELKNDLETYRSKIEEKIKKILYEYATYIEKGDQGWTGSELLELEQFINEAKSIAIRNVENHLLRKRDKFYSYFEMRERHYEILERMLPIVSNLQQEVPQRKLFADFLYQLSESVHWGNTAETQLHKLHEKRMEINQLELPQTRAEFETRARLFHLINEIQLYLEIKNQLKNDLIKTDTNEE